MDIQQLSQEEKAEKLSKARQNYQNKLITFWELEEIFYECAPESEQLRYFNAPRFDCDKVVIGLSQHQIDKEFETFLASCKK